MGEPLSCFCQTEGRRTIAFGLFGAHTTMGMDVSRNGEVTLTANGGLNNGVAELHPNYCPFCGRYLFRQPGTMAGEGSSFGGRGV